MAFPHRAGHVKTEFYKKSVLTQGLGLLKNGFSTRAIVSWSAADGAAGEMAELAAAAVQCVQWPRVWRGTRQKAPVRRQAIAQKGDNSDRVSGRWAAGKTDAERAGASGDGLHRARPRH